MEQRDHAYTDDIKTLAESVRKKFDTLHPLSEASCIYRVPQSKRCLHPSDYTPQMISIGPFHHGKPELKAKEEHKLRYLKYFLKRTKVSIEEFLKLIKDKEANLRNCYAETIELNSDDFATMILVDAVFLLEYFLRGYFPNFITNDDHLFGKPWISLCWDLWLLENQLPLFILDDLFNLAKKYCDYYGELSLIKVCHLFSKCVLPVVPVPEHLLRNYFSGARHFLDLLRLCVQPSQLADRSDFKALNIPGAKELHQAGVKFKSASSKNLLDITFNKGILEIPKITIFDNTETLFRNLLAYERMQDGTLYFNDYIIIMSYLVNTPKDAELLIQHEVVGLGNSERLSNVFQNLVKESTLGETYFQYSGLIGNLQDYCKLRCHHWKANLKQNYFNTPWASISVIAAVILLVLTCIQTFCSIIAL